MRPQNGKTHTPELALVGHSNAVTDVALSEDGKTLVSGSYDETAIVWDMETGTMQRLLPLQEFVNSLVLTPDGKTTVTDNGQVWDVVSGLSLRKSGRYRGALACSPDGKTLASTIYNPREDGWSFLLSGIRSGRTKKQFPCSEYHPDVMTFSADGELVATVYWESADSEDARPITILCDVRTGTMRRTLPGKSVRLFGVAFPPNTRLAAVTTDGAEIWNAETEELLGTISLESLPTFDRSIMSVALSPNGRLVALGTGLGRVLAWDVSAARCVWQAQAHYGWPRAMTFSSDSKTLVTAGDDHAILLWNAADGQLRCTLAERGILLTFA